MGIKNNHLITINNTEGWLRGIVTLKRQPAAYSTLSENRSTYAVTLIAGEDLGELRHYHGGDNRPKAGWVGIDATGIESPKYRTRREALAWILDQRDAAAEADGQDLTAEDYLEDEGERRARESRIRFGIRTAEAEQEELARAARLSRQSARFHLGETERHLAEEALGYAAMHARFAEKHAAKVPNDKVSADAAKRASDLTTEAKVQKAALYYAHGDLTANA